MNENGNSTVDQWCNKLRNDENKLQNVLSRNYLGDPCEDMLLDILQSTTIELTQQPRKRYLQIDQDILDVSHISDLSTYFTTKDIGTPLSMDEMIDTAEELLTMQGKPRIVTQIHTQQQQQQQQQSHPQLQLQQPQTSQHLQHQKPNQQSNQMEYNLNSKRPPKDGANKPRIVENSDNETAPKIKGPRPFQSAKERYEIEEGKDAFKAHRTTSNSSSNGNLAYQTTAQQNTEKLPEELAQYDRHIIDKIESDIIHKGQNVSFDDISGLEFAKECVNELICWPMNKPELFQGLRSLPKGLLLFGPPGTGKTLIGKAVAHESGATFFSISASSLMSKWIGDGEKSVRALFAVANYRQPSVVFIDEVDSLLCQRSSEENEASRRIKTEFMVQLDGAATNQDARVVVIGATNRPEELDEAVRRRFVKRLYIPLPEATSRRALLEILLKQNPHELTSEAFNELVVQTEGFSGADIKNLCTEAALIPLREIAKKHRGSLSLINDNDVPAITMQHFNSAVKGIRPTVSPDDLQRYIDWNKRFGSYQIHSP